MDSAVQNFLIYLFALGGLFYAVRSREPIYFLLLAHIAYLSRSTVRSMCSTGSSARSCRI